MAGSGGASPQHEDRTGFAETVAYYDRYRLAYPERLIARVAALAGLKPGDAVLDLGCGTGMLAIPFARAGMAVTAMDPEAEMLAAAETAQPPGIGIRWEKGGSQDLTPQMGPFRLVVMGRSFHWMDRAATLAMLDRIVMPEGGVALFHDAHPPVEENRWFEVLCEVQKRYRQGSRHGGHRRYEPYLFASAFRQIEGLSVTIRQALTAQDILGRALSMSSPPGVRRDAFAAELMAALRELSPDGKFIEVAELVAVLARRPQK
ncbi:MAG TPA: methyltransferase domain-containing protein [Rhizomicrobium sp.]|nr:methyltransferase domain-containing protein [Rhizomicrobium sp.]